MENDQLFIEEYDLPRPLSKKEIIELFKINDNESRNKIIEHNIRLVLYEINKKFCNVDYEKKELVSIGIVGLVKAVDTFDPSKGWEFNTYAARCIDNEIILVLRKLKKTANDISLDEEIGEENEGIMFKDVLRDDNDFIEEIEKKEALIYLKQLVNNLNERDKKIIMLYFGFYDDKCYSMSEIGHIVKLSRPYVSKIIKKIVNELGSELQHAGFIELHSKKLIRKRIIK